GETAVDPHPPYRQGDRQGHRKLHAVRHLLGLYRPRRGAGRAHQGRVRRQDEDGCDRRSRAVVREFDAGPGDSRLGAESVGVASHLRSQPEMTDVASPLPNRPDELVFLALGGVGEIGMNMSLYGYAGKWLMIDCGIT